MTAAAWTFYAISVLLMFERLKQLERSYPALTSLFYCSGIMLAFMLLDRILTVIG